MVVITHLDHPTQNDIPSFDYQLYFPSSVQKHFIN